jgi:YHS domain-containing protein
MIRFFITRFILPLIVFWLLRMVFKSVGDSMRAVATRQPNPRNPPGVPTGGELKKDPVCGTYVSPDAAVSCTVKGQLLHFCSTACRDKYKG